MSKIRFLEQYNHNLIHTMPDSTNPSTPSEMSPHPVPTEKEKPERKIVGDVIHESGFDTPQRELFRCKVAGIPYRNHPPGTLQSLKLGDAVTLVAEPHNQFDPNAIKVMHGHIHLGYIPKTDTHRVRGWTTMRIARVAPNDKWNEMHVEEVP